LVEDFNYMYKYVHDKGLSVLLHRDTPKWSYNKWVNSFAWDSLLVLSWRWNEI